MNKLKKQVLIKEKKLRTLLSKTPKNQIKINSNLFNNWDNYGNNDDPETEWGNWNNWDQNPHPFSNK